MGDKGIIYKCPHCEYYWGEEIFNKFLKDLDKHIDFIELCCPACKEEKEDE